MNCAAATIFSDRASVEGLSTIPVTLSQKLQASGSDNIPFSYRVPGSAPPPSFQRDLTQPRTASIIAPSAQYRRESTTPSSDFSTTHPLESYLLTTESTRCLGDSFVNERGPTDESFGDGEDQPVAYGQLANSEQSHALDVLPWLKEAIDTVNDLESRIQELEQDCKLIPLYEQNQAEMVEVIQDLESAMQLEQLRRSHIENAVWSSIDILQDTVQSRSLLLNSSAPPTLPAENTISDPYSSQRLKQNWGLVLETRTPESERSVPATIQQDQEHVYKNAITVALEYLRAEVSPKENRDRLRTSGQVTEDWVENARPMLEGLRIQADNEGTADPRVAFKSPCSSLTSSESLESLSTSTSTRAMLIGSTDNFLTNKATITGSAQSLATDLSCMMDERVYLKQHIQSLNRLRHQSQELSQRAEKEYQRQVAEMIDFSKRLLESLGGLTLAQASLEGASELTVAALRKSEHLHRSPQLQNRLPGRQLTESVEQMDSAIRIMKNVTGTCMDMVEKTRFPDMHNSPQSSASIAMIGSHSTSFLPTPQRLEHPAVSLSTPEHRQEQEVRRMAVDDISLREFENHITILRRQCPVNKTLMQSASVCTTDTPYMRQVLTQDIQPCLLMSQGQAYFGKPGWIGAMLHTKSSGPSIYRKLGNKTPWYQRLLSAIERNECEIEYWTASSLSGGYLSVPTVGQPKPTTENMQCCLCGLDRTCEYRLWLTDQSDKKVHIENAVRSRPQTDSRGQSFPLDQFCRGRVVAVCDFFMFMAHLRKGLLDQQPLLELYHRSLILRHRMASARIGCL
ncbi:hypothetical protein MVEG_05705 [Podila verticillata NRRL 6337]|nr:hypothetical protein MVEG_05705 [Podila verticillata NRRL 6337]